MLKKSTGFSTYFVCFIQKLLLDIRDSTDFLASEVTE